jgi:hypothetical protein
MIHIGNLDEISKLIEILGNQIRMIIRNAIELSYYSRGAWTYYDVLNMSAAEREIATEFITKRLEQASKMTFPVF